MNGRVAKRIRKQIYSGDLSPRFRKYKVVTVKIIRIINQDGTPRLGQDGKQFEIHRPMLIADGLRRQYQKAKKQTKERGV